MWEVLLVGGALAAGGYVLAKMAKGVEMRARTYRATTLARQQTAAALRWQQVRSEATRRQAAHNMQVAMQQLAQSPDFRRAASFAGHATHVGVPVAFRQRQFRRLRPLLVEHLTRRLQSGGTMESAAAGLRELVNALGMAAYEADYVASDAQARRVTTTAHVPDYRARLRQLHTEHTQRLEAIRQTPDLEEELREQLLESEQERFREALLDDQEDRR